MLNYHIQELPDLHEGDQTLFPKLTTYSQFAGRKMIKRIAMEAGVHEGVVMVTLDALPRALKSILLEGHTCKIDSLGIFSLSLSFKPSNSSNPSNLSNTSNNPVPEQSRKTNSSNHPEVMISRLNLKVDPTFMKELREEARFTRTDSNVVAIKPSKGHLEEHLHLLLDWFKSRTTDTHPHPTITLQEYATLTGVSRSTASRELKQITSHPEWGITTEGQGNRKVWVQKR